MSSSLRVIPRDCSPRGHGVVMRVVRSVRQSGAQRAAHAEIGVAVGSEHLQDRFALVAGLQEHQSHADRHAHGDSVVRSARDDGDQHVQDQRLHLRNTILAATVHQAQSHSRGEPFERLFLQLREWKRGNREEIEEQVGQLGIHGSEIDESEAQRAGMDDHLFVGMRLQCLVHPRADLWSHALAFAHHQNGEAVIATAQLLFLLAGEVVSEMLLRLLGVKNVG